jgi:plastocyanin
MRRRIPVSRLIRSAVALVLFASLASTASATAAPRIHHVAIEGATFTPATITIALGDTVVWTNKDPYPHTVTSKDGHFDSKELPPDKTFRLKPATKGEFHYICMLHQTMHGTLVVR